MVLSLPTAFFSILPISPYSCYCFYWLIDWFANSLLNNHSCPKGEQRTTSEFQHHPPAASCTLASIYNSNKVIPSRTTLLLQKALPPHSLRLILSLVTFCSALRHLNFFTPRLNRHTNLSHHVPTTIHTRQGAALGSKLHPRDARPRLAIANQHNPAKGRPRYQVSARHSPFSPERQFANIHAHRVESKKPSSTPSTPTPPTGPPPSRTTP